MTRFRDDLSTRRSWQARPPDHSAMTAHGEDDLAEPSHGAWRHYLTSELRETFERKGEAKQDEVVLLAVLADLEWLAGVSVTLPTEVLEPQCRKDDRGVWRRCRGARNVIS
jgi:hypothetical protein